MRDACDVGLSVGSQAHTQGGGHAVPAGASAFEDPSHRVMVLSAIENGALPLKFAYVGSGAWAHDTLAKSIAYKHVVGSARHEAAILRTVNSLRPAIKQIVEIGPGNGQHTTAFITKLAAAGYVCERYLGLDFSRTLLTIAVPSIRSSQSNKFAVTAGLWDVEQRATGQIENWRVGEDPVVVCVLGQTLGNVENPGNVLTNLRRSLRAGDLLLLGLAPRLIGASSDTYLMPYRSRVFRRAALEPLQIVGVDLKQIVFRLRYEDNAVKAYAVFKQRVRVDGMTLERGHVVRCFLSRRFQPQDVRVLLESSGWLPQRSELDDSGEHFAVIAVGD
jgi:L-histidine N-alpha-methyltransferase